MEAFAVGGGDHGVRFIHFDARTQPQEIGDAGAVHVHVKDAHTIALFGKSGRKVYSHGALAHAALAAHDENLVLDMFQTLGNLSVLFGQHGFNAVAAAGIARRRTGRSR